MGKPGKAVLYYVNYGSCKLSGLQPSEGGM